MPSDGNRHTVNGNRIIGIRFADIADDIHLSHK